MVVVTRKIVEFFHSLNIVNFQVEIVLTLFHLKLILIALLFYKNYALELFKKI